MYENSMVLNSQDNEGEPDEIFQKIKNQQIIVR